MKNNQNPATAHHTIMTARRLDNIRSSILVRVNPSGPWPALVTNHGAIAPKGFTFSPFSSNADGLFFTK